MGQYAAGRQHGTEDGRVPLGMRPCVRWGYGVLDGWGKKASLPADDRPFPPRAGAEQPADGIRQTVPGLRMRGCLFRHAVCARC